jgi:hypothetical protein
MPDRGMKSERLRHSDTLARKSLPCIFDDRTLAMQAPGLLLYFRAVALAERPAREKDGEFAFHRKQRSEP